MFCLFKKKKNYNENETTFSEDEFIIPTLRPISFSLTPELYQRKKHEEIIKKFSISKNREEFFH